MKVDDDPKEIACHKEEKAKRITEDLDGRFKTRATLSSCTDIFDSESHPTFALVNIFTSQVLDDASTSVDDALSIGKNQFLDFEKSWPSGFHSSISKNIKLMQARSQGFAMEVGRLFWKLETTSNDLEPDFDQSSIR